MTNPTRRRWFRLLPIVFVLLSAIVAGAQSKSPQKTEQQQSDQNPQQNRVVRVTDSAGRVHTRMRRITTAERLAAAKRLREKKALARRRNSMAAAIAGTAAALANPNTPPVPGTAMSESGQLIPDYFGLTPNYANSPQPKFNGDRVKENWVPNTGIRKFVDKLPGLGFDNRNDIGQYIPVAVPDTSSYPGADYYEIELGEYEEKMHSDLPPTRLRGYRQTNTADPNVSKFHYLGPLIVAQKDRPVRIRFTNRLLTGEGGDLFIPVDTSIMGSGPGSEVADQARENTPADVLCSNPNTKSGCYTQNRGTIHLHGGVTPWISDGTTHQWVTPEGESTPYPQGVSVHAVPDMLRDGRPDPKDQPQGELTFYYTNQQSARLMFYHDHAAGITRLNVYAGMAAGYLLRDKIEKDLIDRGIIPAAEVPLVIQDKTFVDATTIGAEDPTWNWGTGPKDAATGRRAFKTGDLWWPHVYMTAQNPFDLTGTNAMGRWAYGPYFWPPTADIKYPPVKNPYYDPDCEEPNLVCDNPEQPPDIPGTPNPSWGAESFLDTPIVNGTAYPTLTVEPKPYRFRILNAAHDRFWNLQLYEADPAQPKGCADCAEKSEVRMVPAMPNSGLPANWPADAREGGVPDPNLKGPEWIYIGTEGGFLPMPVKVPVQPVTWNNDVTTFNAGNVLDHSLLLGPAERADVIVDFSQFAGKTLILYNDAPAPFPALDPHYDYYTGSPDLREIGGVDSVMAGFGPNTRTIMQIKVAGGNPTPFNYDALVDAFIHKKDQNGTVIQRGVFERGQDPIIVGQASKEYEDAYGMKFPARYPNWGYVRIQDTKVSFRTVDGATISNFEIEPKAIQDEMGETFDDYGRMSAKLGLELRNTTAGTQTFVMQGYADPPTELIKLSKMGTQIGTMDDGTQIWKVTHNGVDTHPVHFHLFHVQVINRVGWDGAIRPPHPTELGWKDTVRISPLEDTIVALRPITPTDLPWPVPNSIRPLEPALPLGSTLGFSRQGPNAVPVSISNQLTNFGWEYVWHCHILSHEENDMMRAIVFAFPPDTPGNVTASVQGNSVTLNWDIKTTAFSSFTVQRATDPQFLNNLQSWTITDTSRRSLIDGSVPSRQTPYYYRVAATNKVGSEVQGYSQIAADSNFSQPVAALVGSTNQLATLTAPTPGTKLSGPVATFNWTAGTGATAYSLWVGNAPGTTTYNSSGVTTATSATLGNLPLDGSTIYVRLHSQVNGVWLSNDYTYTAASQEKAVLFTPTPGNTLPGEVATFEWTPGAGATSYSIWVGSAQGTNNYNSQVTNATSVTLGNLPVDGSPVYVRLYSQIGGVWLYNDYTYTAASQTKAVLTSPAPGSTLPGPVATFGWTPGAGATAYSLWVGNAPGTNNYNSQVTTATSVTLGNLPIDGSTVYVRLYSQLGGVWKYNDYTYTAAMQAKAVLTTPTPGTTFTAASATFNWTAGTGVTSYSIWVGNAPGTNTYNSQVTNATSVTLGNLPIDGSTVYVRLYSQINGAWVFNDYTYTAVTLSKAVLTTPAPGTTLPGTVATFSWTAGSGVTAYSIWVGSAPGLRDYNSQVTAAAGVTLGNLPINGSTVYVRLYSQINGVWLYNDYTYTAFH